jgi:hypothetical protein
MRFDVDGGGGKLLHQSIRRSPPARWRPAHAVRRAIVQSRRGILSGENEIGIWTLQGARLCPAWPPSSSSSRDRSTAQHHHNFSLRLPSTSQSLTPGPAGHASCAAFCGRTPWATGRGGRYGLVIGPIMTGLCYGYARARAIYRAPAQHGTASHWRSLDWRSVVSRP